MRVSVAGNINVDISALISPSTNSEENRIQDLTLSLGGSAANTAVTLARLRREIFLQGAVGDDRFGEDLQVALRKKGVRTEYVRVFEGKTGMCFSAIEKSGDRHLFTYRGVNESYQDIEEGFEFYHFAGMSTSQLESILSSLGSVRFSYNPGGIVTFERPEEVSKIASRAEVLFLNEVEWEFLKSQLKRERLTVITLGKNGSRIEGECSASSYKVEVVDTTGAGDAFNAGFIHAYLEENSLQHCLELGNLLGALTVSQVGAIPDVSYKDIVDYAKEMNVCIDI